MRFILYFSIFMTLLSANLVIITTKPMMALLNFIIFSFGISGIFFSFHSSISGIIEMISYSSAIIVLFVFFIITMNTDNVDYKKSFYLISKKWTKILSYCLFILLSIFMYYFAMYKNIQFLNTFNNVISTKEVGIFLYKHYLLFIGISLNFLLVGLLVACNLYYDVS